jgi:hypothetical protein
VAANDVVRLIYSSTEPNASGSTIGFYVGMPVKFTGAVGPVITNNTTYYVAEVINESDFSISTTVGGAALSLTNYTVTAAGLSCYVGEVTNTAIVTIAYPGILDVTATELTTNFITTPTLPTGTAGTSGFYIGLPVYFVGNVFGGVIEMKVMSKMGYDAATMGNHDFDGGMDGFLKAKEYADFPFLCSNYDFSETILKNQTQDLLIKEIGGLKVGIFGIGVELKGLVPDDKFGETVYLDPISTANRVALELKKKGCDLIICLSHLGYQYESDKISDLKLAAATKNRKNSSFIVPKVRKSATIFIEFCPTPISLGMHIFGFLSNLGKGERKTTKIPRHEDFLLVFSVSSVVDFIVLLRWE